MISEAASCSTIRRMTGRMHLASSYCILQKSTQDTAPVMELYLKPQKILSIELRVEFERVSIFKRIGRIHLAKTYDPRFRLDATEI